MKKTSKGKAGYYAYEKKKRFLIMALMFAIPITIYVTGLIMHHTRNNILTVVAVLGVIPTARFAVSWIMVFLEKSVPEDIVQITEKNAPDLIRGYELCVTAYEGRMPLDAVVVCGNSVACYSSRGNKEKFSFMEQHMAKILSSNDIYGVKVKIFSEKKAYADRIRSLNDNPQPSRDNLKYRVNEQYPDLSGDELIWETLKSIAI